MEQLTSLNPNIKYLNFSNLTNDSISNLPDQIFNSFTNLESLDLKNNSISSLPNQVFNSLSNLEYLDLGNNSISNLHNSVFDTLSNLDCLNINNNPLITRKEFPSLKELSARFLLLNHSKYKLSLD